MSWKNKLMIDKLQKKANKMVVTEVEETLDKIRGKIFSQAKKVGGWRVYIKTLQKDMRFSSG